MSARRKQRQQIACMLFAVDAYACNALTYPFGVRYLDFVYRSTEFPNHFKALPGSRDTGVDQQAFILGLDAQYVATDGVKIPGGGARQPGILSFTRLKGIFPGHHLSIDIGLRFMQLADVFEVGGANFLVIFPGTLSPA